MGGRMRELLNSRFYIKYISFWAIAILISLLSLWDYVQLPLEGYWIAALLLFCIIFYPLEFRVATMRTRKPTFTSSEVNLIEETFNIPFVVEYGRGLTRSFNTRIMMNVGGFIVPIVIGCVMFALVDDKVSALLMFLAAIMITYVLSEFKVPIGVVTPVWVSFLLLPIAYIIS
ncbi:MAG: DUF1614 domain-containing protein, partial [Methermicoccaceae archaeon]